MNDYTPLINPRNLKIIRITKGLTIDELSQMSIASAAEISRCEDFNDIITGKRTVESIAMALKCNITELCGEDIDKYVEPEDEKPVDPVVASFKNKMTDTLVTLFFKSANSQEVSDNRLALQIFKHLFPEPLKVDVSIDPTEAQEQDVDLLEEGVTPNVPEGDLD